MKLTVIPTAAEESIDLSTSLEMTIEKRRLLP